MVSTLLVDPGVLSGAAAFDTAAAAQLGAATVASAPVISAVMPPGVDSTSVMAQALVLQRTVQTLLMLAQFTGERAFRAIAHDVAAGTYSATEAINAASALISG